MSAIVETDVKNENTLWVATLLISGTCIGGGMLAMPIQVSEYGFVLTFLNLFICWAFMTFTGLLLVEATQWVKNETHFSSLSRFLVGDWLKIVCLVVYLFMNYASLVAYTAGGADLIKHWVQSTANISLSYETCCVLFTLIFGFFVFLGATFIGQLNFLLMMGLAVCYVVLVGFGLNHVEPQNLSFRSNFVESVGSFSIILATFSYQMVIPSVCALLKYDMKKLKKAVILGTTLPFVVYSLWVLIIHGAVPLEGSNGLREAFENGSAATVPLRGRFDHWSLNILADGFAFLAVTTSYLGLSLALFYFIKDGFREIKIELSQNSVILLSLLPTLLLAILYPKALLQCLDISGGFGDTILSGLVPIGMVWVGRYKKQLDPTYRIPGGKASLIVATLFFLFILVQNTMMLNLF